MKLLRIIFCSLLLILASASTAQSVTRVVILPFEVSESLVAYSLGLPTSLQRSLNVIDNVYAPPVGDTIMFTQQLLNNDALSVETVAEAFDASVIISGQLIGTDNNATLTINYSGPDYPELKLVPVQVPINQPAETVQTLVNSVISELELAVNAQDRQQVNAVVSQTPSLPSLQAASRAALRFPTADLGGLEAAHQLDPNSSWVVSEYARALALSGDMDAAVQMAENALTLEARDVEALVVRGVVLQSANQPEEALNAFEAALALNPVHPQALVGRGGLLDDAGAAEADFNTALTVYPRMTDAYVQLASLQRQQNPQRALQTLRKGAQTLPDSVTLQRAFISEAVSLGDPAGAVTYYKNLIDTQPNVSATIYSLATLLPDAYSGDVLPYVQRGHALYPTSVNLSLAEAQLLERTGDLKSAELVLTDAVAANPTNVPLINALAVNQAKQGKTEEAASTLQAVTGDSDTVQINLAQLYLESGQSQQALDVLTPLVDSYPDNATVRALYGVALGRLGRFDEANENLDAALELDPNLSLASRAKQLLEQQTNLTGGERVVLDAAAAEAFDAGLNAVEQGNFADAATAFARARQTSDNGLVSFFEGYALQLSGKSRDAISRYEEALAAFPESDIVLNNLGYGYLQIGRFDRALEYLKQAQVKNAENAQVHLNLGLTYYGLSRYADAVSSWDKAVALNPELGDALATLLDDARAKANP